MKVDEIKWILYLDGSAYNDMFLRMFADFDDFKSVMNIIDIPKKYLLKRLLKKTSIRKVIGSHFDIFTYEKNNLYNEITKVNDGKPIIIIFTNSGLGYNAYFPYTLKKYKEKYPNIYYVALYLDIFWGDTSNVTNLLFEENIFDLTYTIEKKDANEFGMILTRTPYSMQSDFANIEIKNDLYFCGASKNRGNILSNIARECIENDVDCKMDIVCYENRDLLEKYSNIINIKNPGDYMNYSQLLQKSLAANCILEIVQSGQEAMTLRPYEAVVYNRKLLTNNVKIKDFPYYNPQYMKIFQSVDEIDWAWIKKREQIDYNYNGEFSPMLFLDKIVKDIEEKELKKC